MTSRQLLTTVLFVHYSALHTSCVCTPWERLIHSSPLYPLSTARLLRFAYLCTPFSLHPVTTAHFCSPHPLLTSPPLKPWCTLSTAYLSTSHSPLTSAPPVPLVHYTHSHLLSTTHTSGPPAHFIHHCTSLPLLTSA